VRTGQLSDPAFVELLRPFVVTSWHGAGEASMPDDVKAIFTKSAIVKRSNVFMFVLDPRGQLVHGFNAVRSGTRGREGELGSKEEIAAALGKLKLSESVAAAVPEHPLVLPDLPGADRGVPAGVRMFVRPEGQGRQLVVEVVPVAVEEWRVLSYPDAAREIDPESIRNWLVQMYPPAIRTVDQKKPFTRITGVLTLTPAGADEESRYALLRGVVHLAKGDETESAFEGTVQMVVTYGRDAADVQSVQGMLKGSYLYRVRGTQPILLTAAIESRPARQVVTAK
jgi:hypothetical protein